MSSEDRCSWDGCRQEASLGYSPRVYLPKKQLCGSHWQQHSAAYVGSEQWIQNLRDMGYFDEDFVGLRQAGETDTPICDDDVAESENEMSKFTKVAPAEKGAQKNEVGRMSANWKQLLEENKKVKATDEQILAEMQRRFPGAKSKQMTDLSGVVGFRAHYNRGGLTDGVVPKTLSVPYDSKGNPVEVRRGRLPSDDSKSAKASKAPTKRVKVKVKAKVKKETAAASA